MSDGRSTEEITTTSDFEAALGELLDAAVHNDIDLRGSWVYTGDRRDSNWEVEIYELE